MDDEKFLLHEKNILHLPGHSKYEDLRMANADFMCRLGSHIIKGRITLDNVADQAHIGKLILRLGELLQKLSFPVTYYDELSADEKKEFADLRTLMENNGSSNFTDIFDLCGGILFRDNRVKM